MAQGDEVQVLAEELFNRLVQGEASAAVPEPRRLAGNSSSP